MTHSVLRFTFFPYCTDDVRSRNSAKQTPHRCASARVWLRFPNAFASPAAVSCSDWSRCRRRFTDTAGWKLRADL